MTKTLEAKPKRITKKQFNEEQKILKLQMQQTSDPNIHLVPAAKQLFEALILHAKEDNLENVERAMNQIMFLSDKRCYVNNFPDNVQFDYENYLIPTLFLTSKLKTFEHLTALLPPDFKKNLTKWNKRAYENVILENTEDLEKYSPVIAEYFQRTIIHDKVDEIPYSKTVSQQFLMNTSLEEQLLRDVEFRTFLASEGVYGTISFELGNLIEKTSAINADVSISIEDKIKELQILNDNFNLVVEDTYNTFILPSFERIKANVRNVWKEISKLEDLMK